MIREPTLHVVRGVDALRPEHGPLLAVVGVFDGLHLGHRYLLRHLVAEAGRRDARPAVITFDSHPDEVLVGAAPPLLVDPAERLRLLGEAGVSVAVVQHFDAALRETEYDAFVRRISDRVRLVGLLMTPDAAFGYQRRGTVEALRDLGERSNPPFEVVVVPPFDVDGRHVSSSEIRRRVAAGDLDGAAALLGRPYAIVGDLDGNGRLAFGLPFALPPAGRYAARLEPADGAPHGGLAVALSVGEAPAEVTVESRDTLADGRVRLVFD